MFVPPSPIGTTIPSSHEVHIAMRKFVLVVLGVILLAGNLAACGSKPEVELKMAPVSQLPPALQQAPAHVREAYQFALANKDVLEKIPCYCGCGAVGHMNNYMCYVQDDGSESGQLVLDSHAYG